MSAFVERALREWRQPPSRTVTWSIALLFLAVDVRVAFAVLGAQPPGVDWAPLWAAARLPFGDARGLYDFAGITRAQAPLLGVVSGLRPFVYPPSALPLLAPFAALPALPSWAAWIAATGAFYMAASARMTAAWRLLPLVPAVALAAIVGQTGFLLGGLLVAGLLLLDRRPGWAGTALGVATAIKPQLLILAPVALAIARERRALVHWAAGGAALVLLSVLGWGWPAWRAWLDALPRFQALIQDNPTLIATAITPYALAQRTGLPGWWALAVAAPPALAAVWITFRRDGPPADRLIALVGGAILLSPYAMNYELALLAPALVAGAGRSLAGAIRLVLVGLSVPFGLGVCGVALALLPLLSFRRAPRLSDRARGRAPAAEHCPT